MSTRPSIYGLSAAPDHEELILKLGRHKTGKGCLYIYYLDEIDLAILEKLIRSAMKAKRSAG